MKLLIGNEADEEEALAAAENESIHIPETQKEAIRMLKSIIFSLKYMNGGNNTLASLSYSKGFKFLNDNSKCPAIYEASCITPFFFAKFLVWLNTINKNFFKKVSVLFQQMISNGLNQFVIPSKLMLKQRKDIKSFLESIEDKLLPIISLPLEIQEVIDKQETRQLEEQQQRLGGQDNDWCKDQRNNQGNDKLNNRCQNFRVRTWLK